MVIECGQSGVDWTEPKDYGPPFGDMVRNHPGGFNVAFADGHVEFLTPEQLRSKLPAAVPEPPE